MAIDQQVISQHIAKWEAKLTIGAYKYRQTWPSRLFRHEPIENVVEVLKSGWLFSRSLAREQSLIVHDIAPDEIINSAVSPHDFVRLYFRPKNPTQFHIEGVRKPSEIYKNKHASVLVMLIFRSNGILTREGVNFSDGNMQSPKTNRWSAGEEFSSLPFDQIYHEGPYAEGEEDIKRRRCAEVLIPDQLDLGQNLEAIVCRSSAERATLLYMLGGQADRWRTKVRVASRPGLFQNQMTYMKEVDCSSQGVSFELHPRRDGSNVRVEISVHDNLGREVIGSNPTDLSPSKKWLVRRPLGNGEYTVSFKLEGCFAYKARHMVDDLPF